MCHENFVLEFGPRLNFIIGHNGSGKSAILTGISICLGAKASETNRGSSLKDLIKEGANSCHIQVVLANEGDEAFEPGKYGSEIIIERVLRRDVQSAPYTLRSENGKKVSQKKADLDAILDYHNIAVNNPMAFLSQDAARSFLTASTDEQKYKFFMRGTLMDEIHQNIKKSRDQVDSMELKIIRMKEALLRLKDDARDAKKLHDRLISSNDLRERQRILHGKYFWMQADKAQDIVNEVRESQLEIQSTIEQLDRYIKDYESKIANFDISKEDFRFKKEHAETVYNDALASAGSKKSERDVFGHKVEATVRKMKETEKLIRDNKMRIADIDKDIRKEEDKIRERNGGSREALENEFENLKGRVNEIEGEKQQISENLASADSHKELYNDLQSQIDEKHQVMRNLQGYIKNAKSSKVDELAPYKDPVKRVVNDVKRGRFHGPVLGPVGTFLSVKQGFEDWASLVESRIGPNLNSFIVENVSDQRQLQSIFRKHHVRANIVLRKPEEFNYSSGIPDRRFTTVLDTLEFSNPAVKFALIDTAKIESIVLIEDRVEAQRVLESHTPNVQMIISKKDKYTGQVSSINRNGAFRVDPLYIDGSQLPKLRPKDRSQNAQAMENRLKGEQAQLRDLEAQKDQITQNINAERAHFSAKKRNLEIEEKRIKSRIYNIQQKLNDDADSGKLEGLKEDRASFEDEIKVYGATTGELQEEILKLKEQLKQKGDEYEELKVASKAAKDEVYSIQKKIMDFDSEKELNITKLQHFEKSKQKRLEEAQAMTENLPAWEKNIEENILQAEESCEKQEADSIRLDSVEAVQDAIEKVTAQVEKANEDLGKTPEQIVNDDAAAREKYAEAKAQFDNAVANKTYYHSSLNDRLKAFRESRGVTFLEADMDFKQSLQFRNFTGNLDFDVNKNKLTMYVSTKNDKKPRHVDSLSGGEKSFSQISLLLATWKPMRSRIKGLDEFDVFMDQVNRKIGMRLMLDKLSKENSQTIFITPQDIGQIAELDERFVRIHRIRDPRAARS